jgi:predicted metal-binding protein
MAVEGAQAQRFIRDLREDTVRGINSKLQKGIAPILAPPGYKNDITKRQGEKDIIPHDLQFSLVKQLFQLYMTGNYSVQQLYDEAIKLGVKSNRGKIVSRTQLYQMLRNPFYTGIRFIYGGKLYTNGIHQRMLKDEEFDLIQTILDGRSHPRGRIHLDLLTGLIRCGECGRAITSEVKTKHYKNGTSQIFTYYRCTKKWKGKKCSQPYLRAEELEQQVLDFLDGLQLSSEFVDWAIKWLKVMHGNQEKLREAKYKETEYAYHEVTKKIGRLVDMTLSGMVTPEEGLTKKHELELEKKGLLEKLEKMDSHISEWSTLAIQTFDLVKNIKERFSKGTIEQRKTILRVIGSDLMIKDKKIDITIRNPFEYIQKAVKELDDKKRLGPNDLAVISSQSAFLGPKNYNVGG